MAGALREPSRGPLPGVDANVAARREGAQNGAADPPLASIFAGVRLMVSVSRLLLSLRRRWATRHWHRLFSTSSALSALMGTWSRKPFAFLI